MRTSKARACDAVAPGAAAVRQLVQECHLEKQTHVSAQATYLTDQICSVSCTCSRPLGIMLTSQAMCREATLELPSCASASFA